jgi:3-deoxy-D-manno-octulosonate 8-phosphate phosphatase (KDO 8-P phosphatase)
VELPKIRGLALDVDGVLTDGTFWWGPGGEEFKRFSFADIMGVSRACKAGVIVALISGEESPLIDRYAQKFALKDIFQGCKDKAAALREFAGRRGLSLAEICFMGDDVNDVAAMAIAGFSAAPANAHPTAREQAKLVTRHKGGKGAVRELVDLIVSRESREETLDPSRSAQP